MTKVTHSCVAFYLGEIEKENNLITYTSVLIRKSLLLARFFYFWYKNKLIQSIVNKID